MVLQSREGSRQYPAAHQERRPGFDGLPVSRWPRVPHVIECRQHPRKEDRPVKKRYTIQAAMYMSAFLLAGCATQDPPPPQRRCVLQETGAQVPDSRCEGAGEPGVTAWYWVQ